MKIAIIGFPGSGKSTVFRAVTDASKREHQNEDSTKPSIGAVKVADERLYKLAAILKPKKIVPEEIVFTDLPGFNTNDIKTHETLMHVIGVFSGNNFTKEADKMATEFIISDLAIIEKKLALLDKELASKPSNQKEFERKVLLKCKEALDNNKPIRMVSFSAEEEKTISGYQFLSAKPVLLLANMDESEAPEKIKSEVEKYSVENSLKGVVFSAKIEAELKELDEVERLEFAKEMGVKEFLADKVVRLSREAMSLITFYTGEFASSETRAWPVRKGSTAPQAAGRIHSDFEKGFIRAEVVAYDDFMRCGNFVEAKNKGLLRLEGKEYVVKDGDIITFHFNV